ncbi:gcpE, (E)-4-hydroxy-3-methylbut-2-enyl-diphosphate synthase [Nostoc sphaeroides CCNUC1]|uniref:GcpE, (E)-4-hydroxy-3-methylbut-2-enyl-diphosphate synthase n=1 Tax=Nostoc sphaeroides CCNUC1 TaxID=2653204 RepID=A0A5P8WFY3_9NOSO|nr:gcpE, (E)-4-hydroxy-3-methylbut-2-enyl-diphosphate synthase [Nostoc sphaeroides CCNUC1]
MHHNGLKIALEVAKHVDSVRINPGLYVFEKPKPDRTEYTQAEFDEIGEKICETLEPFVVSLRDQGKAMRIGVNHGSLAERMRIYLIKERIPLENENIKNSNSIH